MILLKRQLAERYANLCARCWGFPITDSSDSNDVIPRWWIEYKRVRFHKHHIKARQEGGDDTLDNLIPLCGKCHREWHEREGSIDFRRWLDSLPSRWVLAAQNGIDNEERIPGTESLSLEETLNVLRQALWLSPEIIQRRTERNRRIDEHETLYGKQAYYHFKLSEDQHPEQLVMELVSL